MATVNLGRVKPIYKGEYAGGTTYEPLDFVSYNGLSYFCILESTGNLPSNATYWQKVTDNAIATGVSYDNSTSGLTATNVQAAVDELQDEKQAELISGTNIKTVNSTSLLGSGDIAIDEYTDADALSLFHASGSAPVYACRAWVNFNGTGTVAIRASGNVSSITDHGTGDYTVNFITAMPDTNYSVQHSGNYGESGTGSDTGYVQSSATTSSVRVQSFNDLVMPRDFTSVNVEIFR